MNRDLLSSITVRVSADRAVPFTDLLDGWDRHLARLHDESQRPGSPDSWGAHDYFAALSLRDVIARALPRLSSEQARLADARLRGPDILLRTFTEIDDRRLVRTPGDRQTSQDWWWDRIPLRGPVREDLEAWGATA